MSSSRRISPHDPRQAVFVRLQPICNSLRQFVVAFNYELSKKQSIQSSWDPCLTTLNDLRSYLQKWQSVDILLHPLYQEKKFESSLSTTNHFDKLPYFLWESAIGNEKKQKEFHASHIITPLCLVFGVVFLILAQKYPCTKHFFFLCVFFLFVSGILLCSFIGFNEYCYGI